MTAIPDKAVEARSKEPLLGGQLKYDTLSLFAGIGGIDLGLERTGHFRTVAFCEIDPKARLVLAKHWPGVKQYHDVRELTAERLRADGIVPRFVCGGFPCQDISHAGKGAGIEGERSGLFFEMARLIGELRPDGFLLENVSALLTRGLDVVLGTLAALGYDVEWHCIPASAIGAPHRRDRIWIIGIRSDLANASSGRRGGAGGGKMEQQRGAEIVGAGEVVAHAAGEGLPKRGQTLFAAGIEEGETGLVPESKRCRQDVPDAAREGLQGYAGHGESAAGWAYPHGPVGGACLRRLGDAAEWWAVEPAVGRVANGVSGRVDRLKQLGNAVVPQIPEMLGRAFAEVYPCR